MASRRRAASPFNPLGSLVFTLGVAALAIILYATTRLLIEPAPEHWVGNAPPLAEESAEQPFRERAAAVTRRLEKGPMPLGTPAVQPQGSGAVRYEHRQYDLTLPQEQTGGALRALLEAARDGDPTVVTGVEEVEGGERGEIGVDGLLTHTILIHWKLPPTPVPGRVAIVIEDMGDNLLAMRHILSLPFQVAVAVLPFRPFSREVAESAHQGQREVLLHLPVAANGEAQGGVESVRPDDAPDQIGAALDRSLDAVPHVAGMNNHIGTPFSEDPEMMRVVLEHLHQRRLYFLDSVSTPRSTARAVAVVVGVPYVARKVYLDDNVDDAAIRQQLQQLIDAAKRDGQAVAIGRPNQETLNALQDFFEQAKQQGVEIVTVSSLASLRKKEKD